MPSTSRPTSLPGSRSAPLFGARFGAALIAALHLAALHLAALLRAALHIGALHIGALPGAALPRAALLLALAACGATPSGASEELSEARLEELGARWKLYLTNDAKWPEAREQWIAGSTAERELLLDNLCIELLRDDAASRGSGTALRSARARKEFTWFGADAALYLVEAMQGLAEQPTVDVIAIDRVGQALVEVRAIDPLIELLRTTPRDAAHLKLRRAGLRALAQLESAEVTAAIVELLRTDPAWEVRGAAAEALRKRAAGGDARAALAEALADPDGYVRSQAVRSLMVGLDPERDPGAFDRVFAFLRDDPAPEARAAAAESLTLFAFDSRVEAALVFALRDRDPRVMQKAALALANVRSKPVQFALIDALERSVRARDEGLVSELLLILEGNVGSRPRNINPAGWRELVNADDGNR